MRLLIVDSLTLVSHGLKGLLAHDPRFSTVDAVTTIDRAVAYVQFHETDIALTELQLEDGSGVDLIRRLREVSPRTRTVVLTSSESDDDLFVAMSAGAAGYIVKSTRLEALIKQLEWVAAGETALSRPLTARLITRIRDRGGRPVELATVEPVGETPIDRLTPREREVLVWIARGAPNKAIARELSLSAHTIRSHVTNILGKLDFTSRVQAATFAIEHQRELGEGLSTVA